MKELKLERFSTEIMAHEIGHHVYCPGDLNDHARSIARIRAGLPTKEHLAGLVGNLYTDLLINDRLARSKSLDLAGVYRTLGVKSSDSLWRFYMRMYEILWGLPKNDLAPGPIANTLELDAGLGARLIRVYSGKWLDGCGRFAALCLPYLIADGTQAIHNVMSRLHDTKDAGKGGVPDGLAEADDDEESSVIHPSLDEELAGICEGEAEGEEEGRESGREHEQVASRMPAGRARKGDTVPRKRYRDPIEYSEVMKSAGVKLDPERIVMKYYRERALPHLVPFPVKTMPQSMDPLPEGVETWDVGDPIEEIDWLETIVHSPHVVPGLTTVERTYGTSPGRDPGRAPLDLYIGIDCSGSMANPKHYLSYPVLAGAVITLSALRAGSRCSAILSGHEGPHIETEGFVRSEDEILKVLTGYLGTGYAFGIPHLARAFEVRKPTDNPVHILIVTDHDIFAMLGAANGWRIAEQALAKARGGGTFVLHMNLDGEKQVERMRAQGWSVYGVTEWEDILAFARDFSRQKFGSEETA